MNDKIILVICGPSGCGKTYLKDKLCKEYSDIYNTGLQVTTRSMRENEVQGNPYDFISENKFQELVKNNELIGLNLNFNGYNYGTYFSSLDNNKINLLILSKEGYQNLLNSSNTKDYKILLLTIDIDYNLLPDESKRKDRSEDFFNNERMIFNQGQLKYKISSYDDIYYEKVHRDILQKVKEEGYE